MNNLFGKSLRSLMDETGIKESQLAEALSYDATYISKWINGNKLPSARNVERIIGQMVDFFIAYAEGITPENRNTHWQQKYSELKTAYASDSSYLAFQGYNNNQLSYIDNQQTLIQLTRDALMQALEMDKGRVSITATFDLFRLYGKEFKRMMQELRDSGVTKVELKLAILPGDLAEDSFVYTSNILGIIGDLNYIEMSIVSQKPEQPHLIVINDLLCIQVLWNLGGELSAVFSMDSEIIERFTHMCQQIIETSVKLLDPAQPESLKKTNVQLDSYADRRQWLFFNEAPGTLLPDNVMDIFIENAEDEDYGNYLIKLKNIFKKYTCKSQIDLVIYSSALNKYLADGEVCVGNVSHHLTEGQTHEHIKNLREIMLENPKFRMYLIRDTVVLSQELRQAPSLFIDSYGLYIENSKKEPNDNFHISMDPLMRDVFERFFENMVEQSYCTQLTAEDLLRYL